MDFNTLKNEVWKLIDAFEQDGKPLNFAALRYYYNDGKTNHYQLDIAADWLKEATYDNIGYITKKTFAVHDLETRLLISKVSILTDKKTWPIFNDTDILVNEINYKPNYQQLFADMMD